MLKIIKGCKVPDCALLEEQYQATEYGYCANVNEYKIENVMRSFIIAQKTPVFFILELPTNERDELRLRKKDTDPFHTDVYYTDVYYIDGLNSDDALMLLDRYGELLVQDGMSAFGFGAHDSSAEIMSYKYNIVTLFTKTPDKYNDFFDKHDIPRVKCCVTAWDTFTEAMPGECTCVETDDKTVFSLPKELKPLGLYFAERR